MVIFSFTIIALLDITVLCTSFDQIPLENETGKKKEVTAEEIRTYRGSSSLILAFLQCFSFRSLRANYYLLHLLSKQTTGKAGREK